MKKSNTNASFVLPVRVARAVDRSFSYTVKKDIVAKDGTVSRAVKTDEISEVYRVVLQVSYQDADGFDSQALAVPARDYKPDLQAMRGDYLFSVEQFYLPKGQDNTLIIFNGFEPSKAK